MKVKTPKCNITAGWCQRKLHQMYQSFIKVGYRVIMCLKFTYMGVIQQSVHETKIHDIDDVRKRLMQTCFDFYRNIIDAGVTI